MTYIDVHLRVLYCIGSLKIIYLLFVYENYEKFIFLNTTFCILWFLLKDNKNISSQVQLLKLKQVHVKNRSVWNICLRDHKTSLLNNGILVIFGLMNNCLLFWWPQQVLNVIKLKQQHSENSMEYIRNNNQWKRGCLYEFKIIWLTMD